MHFWIDKHSQTCGFSRRHRIPSSLSSSGGGGRRWRGAKPMVTPVHRFQPIECVTGQYLHNHNGRRSNSSERESLPVRSHAVELDSSVFLDLPLDGNAEVSGHTSPQIEPATKHNNCGTKVSFAVVTAIIGGVRLFFQNQGIEIVYSLAFIMLITLCAITMYRSMTRYNMFSPSSTAAVAVATARVPPQPSLITQVHVASVLEDMPLAPSMPLIEPPPPPYDIAVLLPQQILQEDIPPPSYEKAVS